MRSKEISNQLHLLSFTIFNWIPTTTATTIIILYKIILVCNMFSFISVCTAYAHTQLAMSIIRWLYCANDTCQHMLPKTGAHTVYACAYNSYPATVRATYTTISWVYTTTVTKCVYIGLYVGVYMTGSIAPFCYQQQPLVMTACAYVR